jgi:hypothetical protein
MKWIEIIEIRALYKTKEKLEAELKKILTDINEEAGYPELKICSRINLETDFLILIMNSSGSEKNGECQLGIRLNEGLKDYGMVNYSKWDEFRAGEPCSDKSENETQNKSNHENN